MTVVNRTFHGIPVTVSDEGVRDFEQNTVTVTVGAKTRRFPDEHVYDGTVEAWLATKSAMAVVAAAVPGVVS